MVEINKLILTKNNCYKTGKKMTPKGVMYHSTGANNPKLSRYVGPDDGILGKNPYGNHWNQPKPGGRSVCVHAFIGKDKNGKVRIYQTLPWDHVGWHSGSGKQGSANYMGYIGFEICEDALNDKAYFDECINLANQLTAYLVKTYNIPINNKTIISHSEGHKLGIASNHSDIEHWSKKFGITMNDIRKEVQRLVNGTPSEPVKPSQPKVNDDVYVVKKGDTLWGISNKYKVTVNDLKNWNGLKGDLIKIGQKLIVSKSASPVNKPTPAPAKPSTPKKSNFEIAEEVIKGLWGNGNDRKTRLTKAGYDYNAIQALVEILLSKPKQPTKKSNQEIAKEVIAGKWGNGNDRKNRLTKAGYDYNAIQALVNKLLK